MMELQEKLRDIARKGSDSPFDAYRQRRNRKQFSREKMRAVPPAGSNAVQLSLFQNR